MTLLAAFQILLWRYTGQRDVLVGSPIAGRTQAELEGLIGFFVNTLVLRSHMKRQLTFHDVLRQVRETCLAAYSHQDLPFEKIVEAIQPVRDPSRHPIFQVMFQLFQGTLGNGFRLPHVQVEHMQGASQTAKFDLSLSLMATQETIKGSLIFNTDLFSDDTMSRFISYYQTLLEKIVAEPDKPVAQVPFMTEAERHQLLKEWNAPYSKRASKEVITSLFEKQVAKTPDHVAIVAEDEQLTFQELNARANRLAHYLMTKGVGPNGSVGLCMDRSLEMVIGLLAILKAGGIYVPLDPAYPDDQINFRLRNARADFLLTHVKYEKRLSSFVPLTVCLDSDEIVWTDHSVTNPICGVDNCQLAYVIYTSGSTGKPKGVLISHQAIVDHCIVIQNHYGLNINDRVLQFASLTFDASLEQILPTLITGATLVVWNRDVGALEELPKKMTLSRVTVANFPTAYWHILAENPHHLSALVANPEFRVCIVGGEPMLPHAVKSWQSMVSPDVRLLNAYGPTETSVTATIYEVSPNIPHADSPHGIPIGSPLPSRTCYVFDTYENLVPVGVSGELFIGGMNLAEGYLNFPEITAEKFIPDPFSSKPGARLYKTGDRVQYDCNGAINFLGRFDNQIKVRGFRVELGEIETVLSHHAAVREVVVVCLETSPGVKDLVAYVVPTSGSTLDSTALREFLKTRLPDYMVPAVYVLLDTFPLTSNGKINREALPEPDPAHRVGGLTFVPPRTPFEEALAKIWRKFLKIEQIGVHDNFFDLGGHSLLATQVVARIRELVGAEVSVRVLFDCPTIEELAEALPATSSTRPPLSSPPLRPQSREESLPLSFAQQRLWFLEQWNPGSSAYHLPHAWCLRGPLNATALELSLNDLVARHESLRTSFPTVEGQPMQVIATDSPVSLPVVDLRQFKGGAREAEVRRLMQYTAARPFDLSTGPLWRATLLSLGEDDHVFLVTLHHIITDGWSMGIVWRELSALYTAQVNEKPVALPALPIHYADFAVWQRQWLQGEVLEQQLRYWRAQLADAPPHLELPTDMPRPPQQTYRGAKKPVSFPPGLTHALKRLSQESGVTLYMTLLAAFQILLWRNTGQRDILVGSPIAGRTLAELEGLIGFFVNTLVLRTHMKGQPTFHDVLRQVRETCLQAYAHQDLPFEKLVEALQPVRDPSRHPIFQVMFQLFQGTSESGFHLPHLHVDPMGGLSQTAKFDLALSLMSTQETIKGSLIFNTDLFSDDTMTRFVTHYQTLLEALVAEPDQPVTQVPFMTGAERHQLLVDWNPPVSQEPPKQSITSLFEMQAEKTPDRVAVVCGADQMTYQTLNQRATQLGIYLRQRGIKPEMPVGLYYERSLEMLIGLLGILKAGGAYVPIAPSSPLERVTSILSEAKVLFVLTQPSLLNRLESVFHEKNIEIPLSFEWIAVDATDFLSNPCTEPLLKPSVSPANLAYIIFTSGSTGRPKGTMVSHGNIVNAYWAWEKAYELSKTCHVHLQMARVSFDVFTGDMVRALCSGGKLVLCPQENLLMPQELYQLIQEEKVDCAEFVPVVLKILIEYLGETRQRLEFLNLLIVGSDTWEVSDFNQVKMVCGPQTRLLNSYGLTETTIDSAFFESSDQPLLEGGIVPIGRPLPNTQMYLLDNYFQSVPIGAPGEIYIGGTGLSRGYTHHPDLTAERFLPSPYSTRPGQVLYRTGDRARYWPDGNIEFLGRSDHQVKIRGFRIELGEIEMVVRQHDSVKNVVVLCREDAPNEKRLVAYVSAATGTDLDSETLRSFLKARLPDYMLPAMIMVLDAFPVTPSGKVDRRALPVPDSAQRHRSRDFVAPRTPLEELITDIWKELLRMEQISIHDNFFDLGGHSLLATRLLGKLKEACQCDLPLRMFFEQPSIEEQALSIEEYLLREVEHLSESEIQELTDEDS